MSTFHRSSLALSALSAITVTAAAQAESSSPWKPVTDAIVARLEQRLSSYESVFAALSSGKSLRGVFDYKKCEFLFLKAFNETAIINPDEQTSDPACRLTANSKPMSCYGSAKAGMDAVGGMKLDTWEQFGIGLTGRRADKRTYLAASESKLISIRGFVLNYGSVRVYDDGEVLVKVNYLDPRDYTIKMDEMFRCRISNGSDEHGASFFQGL